MNIQTIVCLDLESTGLRESGRPRICEISLLAVNTNDFLELQIKINEYISKQAKQRPKDWQACLIIMACLVSIACQAY